ncbi:hypothetical protein QFC19_002667 [Naganishia cerealis]|uniref:Uncharacterized protein n=1 Tax=Naganishia cerealis TaxID=610337 RepID=A0ACC2W9P8_9TREE|nr:hypothetical protein QFC19_002667 [Naganishia cerealis]
MASNLGNTAISTTMRREGTRAVWYTRYIDWTITTPLLLLTLLLATGLPLGDIMTIIFFDLVMIVCGLVGALIESDYKWGFWVFGMLSLFYIAYNLLAPARASARLLGLDWGRTYSHAAGILLFTWSLYPICWALSEGANVMGTTGEMIFYSGFMHISAVNKLNYADLALSSGKYSDPIDSGVAHHHHTGNTAPHAGQTGTTADAPAGYVKRGLGLFGQKEKEEVQPPHELAPVTAGPVV